MENILAVTGHRPNKLGNEYDYNGPRSFYVASEIDKMLSVIQPTKCISGMALGVDTIFAFRVLKLHIPLIAAVPFAGQETIWPESSQKIYRDILNNSLTSLHIVCEGGYASWKFQKRNEWMVDNCNVLLACWDGSEGGTANCVAYARKIGREIVRVDPRC